MTFLPARIHPHRPVLFRSMQAREQLTEAESKLSTLQTERNTLTGRLGQDVGALGPLTDQCFSATQDKYVYEMCILGMAHQKEGGHQTSLGQHTAYRDGVLHYENGVHCWQGPARSLKVEVVCGQEDRLSRVEEPSRCEYTAVFETPSACDAARGQELRAKWAALEAEAKAAMAAVHTEL